MKKLRMLAAFALIAVLGLGVSKVIAESVSREVWASLMRNKVPEIFCAERSFFVECFEIELSECYQVAEESTSVCLDDYMANIPDPISNEVHWRNEISTCAGKTYHTALLNKRISNSACNTPSNWFPR